MQHIENDMKFRVVIDYELWNILLQNDSKKESRKLSRSEAFFDLMKRERLAMLTDDDNYLNFGIRTLSEEWGWSRPTVVKFLTSLEQIGAVKTVATGYRKTVRLNNIIGPQTRVERKSENSIYSNGISPSAESP